MSHLLMYLGPRAGCWPGPQLGLLAGMCIHGLSPVTGRLPQRMVVGCDEPLAQDREQEGHVS